jgi:hypothetical protein
MKTAVECFAEEIKGGKLITNQKFEELLQQAKEMEKQQIEDAYWDGGQDIPLTEKRCEDYYNEKFKTNG